MITKDKENDRYYLQPGENNWRINKTTVKYLGLGDLSGFLEKDNNLSDLPDKALSRSHLGAPGGVDAQMCTAWVRFDGSGSTAIIKASHNVAAVTRVSAGKHVVKFATPMNNADYDFSYTVGGDNNLVKGGGGDGTPPALDGFSITSYRGIGTGTGIPIDFYGFSINCVSVRGGK